MSIVRLTAVAACIALLACGGRTRLAGEDADVPWGDAPDATDASEVEATPDVAPDAALDALDTADGDVSGPTGRWVEVPSTTPPSSGTNWVAAYDSVRGVVVLFGSDGSGHSVTWEYDGTWGEVVTPTVPPARASCAIAYDAARRVVVLFGGLEADSGTELDDTWAYDGTDWRRIVTSTSPPARLAHAMAYDAARGVVVLFGGALDLRYDPHGPIPALADTWEYDGTDWSEVATPGTPAARYGHAMAYDSTRGVVVLFGGSAVELPWFPWETWEYDGTSWTRVTPAGGPPGGPWPGAMAYDAARERTVYFHWTGTWEYDGASWREIPTSLVVPEFPEIALAYDAARGHLVLFDGLDTREFDGTNWVETAPPSAPPGGLEAMAYDAARDAVVGVERVYLGDLAGPPGTITWERHGESWTRLPTPSELVVDGPTVCEAARGVVVAVGPVRDASWHLIRDDTWERDDSGWRRIGTFPSFDRRLVLALAYDTARRRVVLFGGDTNRSDHFLDDTWEYDGATWSEVAPLTAPPPLQGHAMVCDEARHVVVLFGGYGDDAECRADTWEYDGEEWRQVSPPASPAARAHAAMAYDSTRRVVVLFGGACRSTETPTETSRFDDTWEYDGTNWTRIETTIAPSPRTATMVYDAAGGRSVLVGGSEHDETWEYYGP